MESGWRISLRSKPINGLRDSFQALSPLALPIQALVMRASSALSHVETKEGKA